MKLVDAQSAHEATMLLDQVCNDHPGLVIVSHSPRIWSQFHNHDVDFMHVLCDGKQVEVYRNASADVNRCKNWLACSHAPRGTPPTPPELPEGFNDTKWCCSSIMCEFVGIFETGGVPLFNLDSKFLVDFIEPVAEWEATDSMSAGDKNVLDNRAER